MNGARPLLALRFDVDSIRCIEDGIPRLRHLADRLGVRFTFFVNMGRSFNWTYQVRHVLRTRRAATDLSTAPVPSGERATAPGRAVTAERRSLPTTQKLGWSAVLRTLAFNPVLGDRYRETFDALHAEGHELGLHGGTDHVIWQRALDRLGPAALERLYRPAAERFSERYGPPRAFASPGFRFDDAVLDLLDREEYTYASDMAGEEPFLPAGRSTWQVPVNVLGEGRVPLIEQGLARGSHEDVIVDGIVSEIRRRPCALMYGHPYVEGVRADLLERVIAPLLDEYDVLPVRDYLDRWKAREGLPPRA